MKKILALDAGQNKAVNPISEEAQDLILPTATLNQTTILGLKSITQKLALLQREFLVTDTGKAGTWYIDVHDNDTIEDFATCVTTSWGTGRFKRKDVKDTVYLSWFGCISDWNGLTRTGTDCTQFIQNAIDFLKRKNGGKIIVDGQYLVNSTIFVNTDEQKPIWFEGISSAKTDDYNNGSIFYRQDPGDCLRVNLDEQGAGYLEYPKLYNRFMFEKIQFVRKPKFDGTKSTGMVGIRTFRTQSATISEVGCVGFDYCIIQNDNDINGVESYNDQWDIRNVRCVNSTKGFLKLFQTDTTDLSMLSFEDPLATCTEGIVIKNGTTTGVRNVVYWNPNDGDPTLSSSKFIEFINCRGCSAKELHIERCVFEKVISINNCKSMKVEGVHSRYRSNDFIEIKNSESVRVKNWDSWEDKPLGCYDIKCIGSCKDITLDNYTFTTFTGSVTRKPNVLGAVFFGKSNFITATDSDFVIEKSDLGNKIILPQITQNRVLSLPTQGDNRNLITLFVRNTNFKWILSTPILTSSNALIYELRPNSVYVVNCDETGTYRLISIFSDFVFLSDSNTYQGLNTFTNFTYFYKNVKIGKNNTDNDLSTKLLIDADLDGSPDTSGIWVKGQIQSSVTGAAYIFRTTANVAYSDIPLPTLPHYRASQGNLNNRIVQNQHGFLVEANLVGGVNNFSFTGLIPDGLNRWNLNMEGTAPNHVFGNLLLGTRVNTGEKLVVAGESLFKGKAKFETGTNKPFDSITLSAGTASKSNSQVTTSSKILAIHRSVSGAKGVLDTQAGNGTFTVNSSSNTDNSIIDIFIFN